MMELGYLNECMKADVRLKKGVFWFAIMMLFIMVVVWNVLDFLSEVIF